MATVEQALFDTQQAFDGVAPTYDRSNSENTTLCEMRQRTLRALETHVARGLARPRPWLRAGCDGEYLAKRGHHVTAVDWSPAMVGEARRRMRDAGVETRVDVRHLGIHELDKLAPAMFDAAVSNLGPLNCVPDVARAARLIADRLRPGGVLAASVIGRVCPWEIARFLASGDWARARIRFSRNLEPVPLNGRTVWTRYYTPSAFERAFREPGSSASRCARWASSFPLRTCRDLRRGTRPWSRACSDSRICVGDWPGIRTWGDHFLIVLRKAP